MHIFFCISFPFLFSPNIYSSFSAISPLLYPHFPHFLLTFSHPFQLYLSLFCSSLPPFSHCFLSFSSSSPPQSPLLYPHYTPLICSSFILVFPSSFPLHYPFTPLSFPLVPPWFPHEFPSHSASFPLLSPLLPPDSPFASPFPPAISLHSS